MAKAASVLSVGDLHVENFGTWRDTEGRLVWGINDFDEAYPMAYTNDLVRLATSALLAARENHLALNADEACSAILEGYQEAMVQGGRPFVLAEGHRLLREAATSNLRDPVAFWDKLDNLATVAETVDPKVTAALEQWLPEKGLTYRVVHRIAGLGSLGRQRFVALADWRGGRIAREAKALTVSACLWEKETKNGSEILYQKILDTSVRVLDPWVHLSSSWIIRTSGPRLQPRGTGGPAKRTRRTEALAGNGSGDGQRPRGRRCDEDGDSARFAGAARSLVTEGRGGNG